MESVLPVFLFAAMAALVPLGLLGLGTLLGPRRETAVKRMPYESGMDPFHDARRRFDVRFHLVAVAFLIFDVELLFLYPWAVAGRNPEGIHQAVADQLIAGRGIVFAGATLFICLLVAGLIYEWRRGVLRWQ
jgi:NADH-quinone oxidoreductase subunit A